jgi:hypothetical protein
MRFGRQSGMLSRVQDMRDTLGYAPSADKKIICCTLFFSAEVKIFSKIE